MSSHIAARTRFALVLSSALALAACSDEPQAPPERAGGDRPSAQNGRGSAAPRAGAPAAGGAAQAGDAGAGDRAPPMQLQDSDFLESDRTRDPFRNFADDFVVHGSTDQDDQSYIKLRQYSLDELHLVAVVLGTDNPYAMVIDPSGRGTIIRRGDRVGKPDTISGGPEGMLAHQVPWRVSRILGSNIVRRAADNTLEELPGRVVLEREDRLNPNNRSEHILTLSPLEGSAPADGPQSMPGAPSIPGLPPGLTTQSLALPPGVTPGAGPNGAQTYVQTYTTVVPPSPAAPAAPPTTVVIQTGPHGETSVSGQNPGSNTGAQPSQGPRDPYGPPAGGNNQPPPVQINSGPTFAPAPLPTSGLPR